MYTECKLNKIVIYSICINKISKDQEPIYVELINIKGIEDLCIKNYE